MLSDPNVEPKKPWGRIWGRSPVARKPSETDREQSLHQKDSRGSGGSMVESPLEEYYTSYVVTPPEVGREQGSKMTSTTRALQWFSDATSGSHCFSMVFSVVFW